jgi:Fe/S biogenesis protein NfuA
MSSETVLNIDPDAVATICQIRDQEPGDDEFALLIEVTGFRGTQFNYELSFAPVSDAGDGHILERHGDLAVMMADADLGKLSGASLRVTDQGLAMDNPNTPASPAMESPQGDLTGPLADQVAQVLAHQVNPAIAGHGGAAELVSVDESVVYLRLLGGCQGCGMAQVTLRQGIERILMDAIPDITEIVDVTDHASGSDPYYEAAKK